MTLEDTDTRVPTTAAEDSTRAARRPRPAPVEQPLASRMLDFVGQASAVGGRLGGLALLFRSAFLPSDGGGAPADLADAAEIVADCMEAMSASLIQLGDQAHQVHNHEARGERDDRQAATGAG